ncbi:MAG: response regulator [Anaerolineae bacterium]|nr:response regulator [Anaerolineae bacterium]
MEERIKILLLEDDQVDRMAFERLVKQEQLPYDYVLATSVSEARQALQANHFDAVLVDYLLGDGTAFDLFADMGDTPFVIVTGSGDEAIAVEAMKAGALDYLTKDPQGNYLKTLPVTVENVIRHKQAEAELKQYREHLEELVTERTAQLAEANKQLAAEIAERNRTEEEVQRRNRELTLLNRVIAASTASLEPDTVLQTVCRELAAAFDVPRVAATLFNPEKTEGKVIAEYSTRDESTTVGQIVPVKNNGLFQNLLAHKTPLTVDDAQNDPQLVLAHHLMCQRGTVSLLLLPLTNKQEIIGSLCLNTTEPRHFTAEEINLARSVAEQVSGVLVRAQLVQEHRQLEEQLRQAQKMEAIGRLAGGMAHDFNNLLTVITGYSELLLHRHIERHDPRYKDIEQIFKAGERATALTRQLLAFSRQQVIQPEILDLNAIITDTNEMLRRLISEDIDLITILDPTLGHIKADANQIESIILNLAVNAYDAMPHGGKLTIKTSNLKLGAGSADKPIGLEPGRYVLLTVSDTGIGMDAETLSHIFEPFFTTKAKGKGTGLGLATVYGIVQQNKGGLSVSSQPGRGATFQIYLPQIEPVKPLAGAEPGLSKPLRGTETILLVEDEDMVRELARYALVQNGYRVLEARHGREALEVCRQHEGPIHLLLTDVVMPSGLSGRNLAEQLTALYPETKVLYMSGYVDKAIVQRGVLDPNIAFLPKPFSPVSLSRKVREVLDA